MPNFWWVNHNLTARQEIEGQYLWSPKTESNGYRSEFYNNMRRANPGDLVLSYSEQAIRYVGRVAEFAFTAPKPAEFGRTGANWSQEGWLLPVFWVPVEPPVSPRDLLKTIAPLLPGKYSPFNPATGMGNQKAYLAPISRDLFEAITTSTTYSFGLLARGGANSLTFDVVSDLLDSAVEQEIKADLTLADTVKEAVVKARRGQGRFRSNVEAIEQGCRLTGITTPALLFASHIKPWRSCSSAQERLDGMNGLLLTPDADHLFDRGFISFEDNGEVLISQRVDRDDLRRLGLERIAFERFGLSEAPALWNAGSFAPQQREYLSYHRSEVFID